MDLKDKLSAVDAEIKDLTTKAQGAWGEFDAARKQFAESGADANDTDSDAFKAAEEKHREYAELSQSIGKKNKVREGIWTMMSESGVEAPREIKEIREEVKDRAHSLGFTEQALASDDYKRLKDSGILADGSRVPIGTVMLAKQGGGDDAKGAAEFKTLVTEGSPQSPNSATDAGAFIRPDRVGYYALPERPLLLTDLVTVGTTQTNAVEWVQQTGFTNNAAFVAEAVATGDGSGAKPESALAFAIKQAVVKTLAHWVPATRNALADVGQLRTIIEEQLRYGLGYVLDSQMVTGDGTGQNLTGIVNTAGIGSQARGADTHADAIHKAMTAIRLQYLEPNAVALNPSDAEKLRIAKDSTGNYIFGPPSLQSEVSSIWGKPIVQGAQFAAGTGLVADFRQAILWLRDGIQVLASDSHSDFFVRNLIAVLAEMRAAFGVVRPAAFVKVTGL
jgi:HK97 family phage major capsid protein